MLRKYGFKVAVILSVLLLSAVFAYTHSGRTDKYGGHHDRINGGYHYHNSGTVGKSSTSTLPRGITSTIPDFTTDPVIPDFAARGSDIYFPTKLEWLTLQLNAKYNMQYDEMVGIFQENKGTDTIMIEITYVPGSSIEQRNKLIELMKHAINLEAMRYGWQEWVKVDVKTESFVPPVQ